MIYYKNVLLVEPDDVDVLVVVAFVQFHYFDDYLRLLGLLRPNLIFDLL